MPADRESVSLTSSHNYNLGIDQSEADVVNYIYTHPDMYLYMEVRRTACRSGQRVDTLMGNIDCMAFKCIYTCAVYRQVGISTAVVE